MSTTVQDNGTVQVAFFLVIRLNIIIVKINLVYCNISLLFFIFKGTVMQII